MMHQNQNSSLGNLESLKAQVYDMYYLVPAPFAAFAPPDQDRDPVKWEHVYSCDNVE